MTPNWRWITRHPVYFIAFGLGTGLSPKAPGTVGTLLGYPLYFALVTPTLGLSDATIIIAFILAFIIGIIICDTTGKAIGIADHSGIVWDEIVAMAFVLYCIPSGWNWWLGGFVAFRFFDILKPWPIHFFDQRWQNGFGVMFDDLLAAGYAILLLRGIHWLSA